MVLAVAACTSGGYTKAQDRLTRQLHTAAVTSARNSGDATPTRISVVSSRYVRARKVVSRNAPPLAPVPNVRVYVLQIRGHFACLMCFSAGRTKYPPSRRKGGTVLTVIIDAKTFKPRGYTLWKRGPGLEPRPPPIEKLGKVATVPT